MSSTSIRRPCKRESSTRIQPRIRGTRRDPPPMPPMPPLPVSPDVPSPPMPHSQMTYVNVLTDVCVLQSLVLLPLSTLRKPKASPYPLHDAASSPLLLVAVAVATTTDFRATPVAAVAVEAGVCAIMPGAELVLAGALLGVAELVLDAALLAAAAVATTGAVRAASVAAIVVDVALIVLAVDATLAQAAAEADLAACGALAAVAVEAGVPLRRAGRPCNEPDRSSCSFRTKGPRRPTETSTPPLTSPTPTLLLYANRRPALIARCGPAQCPGDGTLVPPSPNPSGHCGPLLTFFRHPSRGARALITDMAYAQQPKNVFSFRELPRQGRAISNVVWPPRIGCGRGRNAG